MHKITLRYEGVTRVWMSERVIKLLKKRKKRAELETARLLTIVKRFAQDGFEAKEGRGNLVSEGQEVWRLGIEASLFRLIGFYGPNGRDDFIIIDGYLKLGQGMTGPQDDCIDRVAKVKKNHDWET